MATSLTTRINVSVTGTYTKARDLQSGSYPISTSYVKNLAQGTSVDQADLEYDAIVTLAPSAVLDIDLNGVLLDAFGVAIPFLKIKALYLSALPANTNNIIVGNAAANPWIGPFGGATHTVAVKPGGVITWADGAGWAVVAGTGDILRLTNSAGTTPVTATIILIGDSV